MKKLILRLFIGWLCLLHTAHTQAETTFAGALLSGRNEGLLAGNIEVTVRGGEVVFQSTLFQSLVSGSRLEPVLGVQNKAISFDYGVGSPGRFQLGEFLGPIPGWDMTPICGWEFMVIDPGFRDPWYSDGIRFTGSFTAFPGLENLLRAKGGTLELLINGAVAGVQDQVFAAVLVEGWPPRADQFTADISGENAVPPTASPFRATGSFTLTGNCLNYSLAWDGSFAWNFAGIFGPAGWRSTSTNLVADLSAPMRISFTGGPDSAGQIIYQGALSLDDDAVKQLKLGKLYVSLPTTQYPGGAIRGQIVPVSRMDRKLNPR